MVEAAPPKKSDLGVRTLSAIVMLAVAGTALWLGGWVWIALVILISCGVIWEWNAIARRFAQSPISRVAWAVASVVYVSVAAYLLLEIRSGLEGFFLILVLLGSVIGVDVGAYFAGRAIGGPKIAPKISPSKTWAGLFGGIVGSAIISGVLFYVWREAGACEAYHGIGNADGSGRSFGFDGSCSLSLGPVDWFMQSTAIWGALVAIVAQSGDFFESWMKRRAGVKDSSNLIPGHGGFFDRVDGLLAVCFVSGALSLIFGGNL